MKVNFQIQSFNLDPTSFNAAYPFTLSGRYFVSGLYNSGGGGYWWSNTAASVDEVYIMSAWDLGARVNLTQGEYIGFSIRCLAR